MTEEKIKEEVAEEIKDEVKEEPVTEEIPQEEKKEDEDLQARFLRLSADFQNFRRRSEAEKSDIYAYANEKILLQVLEVIDNFERAMDAAPADDKFAEGMELILKQLIGILDKNNVKEIEALDKPFDPAFHNAVMTENVEGKDSGIVTKVLQKGYLLNTKVIRPSMVVVSE
ncbi:MAG: nucleotide exchange factor GrpE [Bacillota bacterium]|nr:nucleotide exchange factor GrpE [Bacillota bacterium]